MTGSEPQLSVVLAAYNEHESFTATADEILAVLTSLPVSAELLVVDDGSTDGTSALADALAARDGLDARLRVRVIHHAPNRGLGGVYRTGFDQSLGEYITFFPADGQFPADIIAQFLPRMADHDMVLGTLPRRDGSWVGKTLSLIERMLYRVLIGPMPKFQGILMFRRALLAHATLHSTGRGWAILLEFIIRSTRGGASYCNVATAVRPRAHGVSKVNNGRTIWSNTKQLLTLRETLRR